MDDQGDDHRGSQPSGPARLPTGVAGLDAVLGGGVVAGDAYLVRGAPGTGKTTLGNELAYAWATAGSGAVVATVLTETHDRMLAHLRGFRFYDPAQVARRVHYVSLSRALVEGGLDGVARELVGAVRDHGATLLVVDGVGFAEAAAPTAVDAARFVQRLQARLSPLGCTTVLLAAGHPEAAGGVATQVDGLLELALDRTNSRDVRWLRVAKLRGGAPLGGRHEFAIDERGVAVFPRLEAARGEPVTASGAGWEPIPSGVGGLDAMLGGGLLPGSSTMVLGTPGAGKTLLGLHFLAEGARRGEPGLAAIFAQPPAQVVRAGERIGLGLAAHVEAGRVRFLRRPALEGSPDAWAWELLSALDAHGTRRLVVDAASDLYRLFAVPERRATFVTALSNELRGRGVTALFVVEMESFVAPELAIPVPAVSATMDNGILLRAVERGSRLHRLVSVLKTRESPFDPTVREFAIGARGIEIGQPFSCGAGPPAGGADPGRGGG